MADVSSTNSPKFIADENVGKLTRSLRLLGFDTTFFNGENDSQMVNIALEQNRIILTRDTHIQERRLITSGAIRAVLIRSDEIEAQTRQVLDELSLSELIKPFTLCLEDNQPLESRTKEEVRDRVPPYVFQTHNQYMECPLCHRYYWKGTHWQAMIKTLDKLLKSFS